MAKKRGPISRAGVKRLMKQSNPEIRIKPAALDEVVHLLEAKAKCYGTKGAAFAKQAKRKTITKDTIFLVEKIDACGTAPREMHVSPALIKAVAGVPVKEITKVAHKKKKTGKAKS